MSQAALAQLQQITTREDATALLSQVIHTPYPLAVWRLPNEAKIFAIVDLSGSGQDYDQNLEELHEAFLINPYNASHPVAPQVLQGNIIIHIHNSEAELRIAPTTSSDQLEGFRQALESKKADPIHQPVADISSGDFSTMVADAVQSIRQGKLEKVVLSRYEDFDHQGEDPLSLFERIAEMYPRAFCHLTSTTHGIWLGASPEKLLSIEGQRYFSTDALAGTQPLAESISLSEVAWMQKEIEEQAMVSRYIIACFKKIRLREFDEIGPKTVRAGNLAHLKTEFKVDMEATNSPLLGSTMLDLLHPTSAVCGFPRETADDFIKAHEGYDRSLYAGFMGPVGFNGNTHLFVNLRCLQLIGDKARLYAGAGITEDSRPEKELAETAHKMQTLLKALHS
ncbi:chorismate-binding protein [Marinoscillum furvescens]|uniref:Isochorismate synthase n=1 Tax=Marinoscillum furvescens DSM 4134 TaxID=1122208 RepID=A0A3D9L032_MARFU|nr:chorismate-binding protein [Marinoscillum furvescens]RED93893.1 isochorismate synthase [Marinoscillum furvescens DSM 4134]